LFFGGRGMGGLVYNANDASAIFGDAFINNNNQISFTRAASTNAADDGIYVYNHATGMTTRVPGPLGATSYTKSADQRSRHHRHAREVQHAAGVDELQPATNAFTTYAVETSGDPNSPCAFIYAPAFNNNNRIAAQVNLTGNARRPSRSCGIWNPKRLIHLVASGDSSAGPTFYAFDNSISMNNNDQVAFITRTAPGASRRIVVSSGMTTIGFSRRSARRGFHQPRQLRAGGE
jgi:hypothetical protein